MTGRESQWKGIGQWQKGNWQGFVNPLLKTHKPQIVRLAHRSSEAHRFCLWKVPARKLHFRGRLWKSGSGLDWCPTPSGRGWEETAYNEISGPGDGEPLLWLTLVSQSDGKRSWETEEEDGMLGREEEGTQSGRETCLVNLPLFRLSYYCCCSLVTESCSDLLPSHGL